MYWAPGQSYNVVLTNPQGYFYAYTPQPGYVQFTEYVLTAASYDAGIYYSEDPSVTTSNEVYISPTVITFTATVAAGAPTENDGYALMCLPEKLFGLPGFISITPCAATPPTPVITSITPAVWPVGVSTPITITGTGFIAANNPNGCQYTETSVSGGSGGPSNSNVAVSVTSVNATTITATVTPLAGDPAETATVTTYNYPMNNPQVPLTGTATAQVVPAPGVTLQRLDLIDVQATGTPTGGTFSLSTQTDPASTTSTYATIDFATGSTSTTNPTTLELTEPANPSPTGSYSPGGLEDITVTYTTAGSTANDEFKVPTFGMSCYDTTLQSDWGTAPNNCQSQTIKGVKYSGTVTNPAGLPKGTYCNLFIAEIKLQGSAQLDSGQDIQYIAGKLVQVSAIATHDGTPPVANQTVARDLSIIPPKGVLMDLDQVGTGLLANDIGGDITGYRIDYYKGVGKAVCANYNNIMAVGACTPATSGCPASAVQ